MNEENVPWWAAPCFWGARAMAVLGMMVIPMDPMLALTAMTIAWLIELAATAVVVAEDEDD